MSLAGAKVCLLLLFCALVCASCQATQFLRTPADGRGAWKRNYLSRHPGTQSGYGASFGLYPSYASSSGAKSANSSLFNVLDFNAKGDGVTDNVSPFQNALNAAGSGGIVFVPPGQYAFKTNTTITVPRGVTLQGTYRTVPSHQVVAKEKVDGGSILLAYAGEGGEGGCFIQLSEDSTISGFSIYYPNQDPQQVPKVYPWSVCMTGNNPAVTDLECLNCWNAVRAVGAARHYIARVQGQPINTGVYVDETYDIGRVEDVHFNPWYSPDKTFMSWQLLHGRSFVFARTDWEYVFNTFSFGYAIGYHFVASDKGSCNGNFLGIGADMAANASVQVDAADGFGILITNGEFTAFVDPHFGQQYADSTQVLVTSSNTGSVSFVNSAFWGPSNQIATLNGSGTTSFSDCIFNFWDKDKKGNHAIKVGTASGNLLVEGCDFQHDGPQVDLGSSLKKAVVMGNTFKGTTRMSGKASNTQIGLNADDTPKFTCC